MLTKIVTHCCEYLDDVIRQLFGGEYDDYPVRTHILQMSPRLDILDGIFQDCVYGHMKYAHTPKID